VSLEYHTSIVNLNVELMRRGINHGFDFETGSLLPFMRDQLVRRFLEAPTETHLLFVDADQGFSPEVVLGLLELDKDIAAAGVPMKQVNWKGVQAAAIAGVETDALAAHAADLVAPAPFVVNGDVQREGTAFRVLRAGTGMLLIKRHVLEALVSRHPELMYRTRDHSDRPSCNLFGSVASGGELYGEDHAFCNRATAAGFEIWWNPAHPVDHVGSYVYRAPAIRNMRLARERRSESAPQTRAAPMPTQNRAERRRAEKVARKAWKAGAGA
jgi:hypothetical protein